MASKLQPENITPDKPVVPDKPVCGFPDEPVVPDEPVCGYPAKPVAPVPVVPVPVVPVPVVPVPVVPVPVPDEPDEPVVSDEPDEPVVSDEPDEPVVSDDSDEPVVSDKQPYNYKPKSESKLIRGFQFTFSDGIIEDRLLFESILSHALDNVSNLGGKMVIAFPDSNPAEVSVITKQLLNYLAKII